MLDSMKLTSTRVVHRCVYANQEYINLQKDNTGYLKYGEKFGIGWLGVGWFWY